MARNKVIKVRVTQKEKEDLEKIAFNLNRITKGEPYDVSKMIRRKVDDILRDYAFFLRD